MQRMVLPWPKKIQNCRKRRDVVSLEEEEEEKK